MTKLSRWIPAFAGMTIILSIGCKTIPVDESWRNTRPVATAPAVTKLPVFQKATLPNGLTIMVASDHRLPIADIKLVIRAGSARDAVHKWGQGSLCFDLLDEGAGAYDALELTQAFADIGTQLSIGVTQDAGTLELPLLSKHLKRGLELLSIEVQQPHFHTVDFERVKTLYMSTLTAKQSVPSSIAMNAFLERAYGRDHPYGHDSQGTLTSIPKVTRSDVKQFWSDYFSPDQTAIVITGDVTMEQASAWVNEYFGDWKHAPVKSAVIPSPPVAKESIQKLARASAPQTFVVVGRPLVSALDADRPALDVMNEIIGGMFSSRLNMNLREGKSWTYGAKSMLNPWQNNGPWFAASSIQVPYAGQALTEIQHELTRMRNEPVTDAELNMAKDGLLKSFPTRFETIEAIAANGANLFVYDLPLDYLDQWQPKIALVTKEDVQASADKALQFNRMTVVAVGDMDAMKDLR